jgi:outer membrane protein assembly factor BamB
MQHAATTPTANGGAIVGSPVVSGLRVIVLVNQLGDGASADPQSGTAGPYLVAFDRRDGRPLWRSAPIVTGMGYYTNATPTIERGVIVAGFSSVEGDPHGQGGVALLNERTGAILRRVYTVPPSDWPAGYAGGGMWTTAAADDGYVYYGVGNPSSKQIEHAFTNAILKVDVDRRRHATFGRVVASYKGNVEQIYQAFQDAGRPLCALESVTPSAGDFSACLQLDLDFGAAVNLFPDADGTLLVGELQKSGVYHAARTADMGGAWLRLLNVSCLICNGAASAWDAARRAIYVNLSPTGLLAKVSDAGQLNWYRPDVDGLDFEAVSLANGVVYLVDQLGTLLAWDADDGTLLLVRPTILDGVDHTLGVNSAGVTIARNTVYVPTGPMLVAYRLP